MVPAGAPSLTSIDFRITSTMFSDKVTSCRAIRVYPAEKLVRVYRNSPNELKPEAHEYLGSFCVTPFARSDAKA
jgi:hypothetical protein